MENRGKMKRFNSLSDYFKRVYGEKLIKLCVDGGFTCPNRDGKLGTGGCAFCSETGSGEYSGHIIEGVKLQSESIAEQLESQKGLLSKKWQTHAYIAFFQNFTNTYKPLETLDVLYGEAMACEGIKGLVIATRPDCIEEGHIELFKRYNVLWVELGLQTIHDTKAIWMNRQYEMATFLRAYELLKANGIKVVIHLMAGLPGETKSDFLESIKKISALKPFGVKIHMLNIIRGTELEKKYDKERFYVLEESEYIEWVCEALAYLDRDIVIHRLTGDGAKESLIAPNWVLNKRSVLNGIDKRLAQLDVRQGDRVK